MASSSTNYTLFDIATMTGKSPFRQPGFVRPVAGIGSVASRKIDCLYSVQVIGFTGGFLGIAALGFGLLIAISSSQSSGAYTTTGAIIAGAGGGGILIGFAVGGVLAYRSFFRNLSKDEVRELIGNEGEIAIEEFNDLQDRYADKCRAKADRLKKTAGNCKSAWSAELICEERKLRAIVANVEQEKANYKNTIDLLVSEIRGS